MRNTNVGDLLRRIDGLGVILDAPTEDRLRYYPKVAVGPGLVEELRDNKAVIIRILRENADMRRTGIVQVERQVFDLAREYFGLDEKGGAA